MSKTEEYISRSENVILHTYNRFPVVLEKGEGVYLTDVEGKKYLDFGAGIAVFALGYHYQDYDEALKNQIDQLIHTSNLYYNVPLMTAGEAVTKASGLSKVFFTNSGTEAIEGAIKAARKYAWNKDGCTDHEIIAMKHSFHGRSMGALSVTGNSHYQEPFKPLIGGIRFADFNDLESVKAQVTKKTCAIILETVQGEGGIYPATKEFLQGVKKICEENDILLILDEIQCGMGRTGSMYAWQEYGVEPDIMSLAKGIAGGVPMGAVVAKQEIASAFCPGDHGSTFGGSNLAVATSASVLSELVRGDYAAHAAEVGAYFAEQLAQVPHVAEVRGSGLMLGCDLDDTVNDAHDVVAAALNAGFVINATGAHTLRFLPPLVCQKPDVDALIAALTKILG